MSKLIYVFKTKFAKGNFDIQMYELPVENETAKTYFVDNPYTYRSRILKKDIGIVIENSFGNMQVYLEDNDFSKARTIFAAYNMDKLENAKRKVDMFREINASLTHTDVLESKINELSEIEKDKIYRMVWAERVTEDILSHAEDIGVEISKEDAEILAESYACDDLAIYTGLKVRKILRELTEKEYDRELVDESDKNIDGKYRYEINCMYEIELENGEIINVYEDEINPDYKGDYTE